MRIALLSMMEPIAAGHPQRRAFLTVGGRTIAQHQADAALALGCEKVICLVRSMEPMLARVQHSVEALGASFRTIASLADLGPLLTQGDELLVFADGLLVEADQVRSHVAGGPAVLVQPVETGVPDGFERIDLNNASAGVLLLPGSIGEKLAALPADFDPISALGRVGLQAGVPQRSIPVAARAGSAWQLITDEREAYAIESDWIAHRLGYDRHPSPSRMIARMAALGFGSRMVQGDQTSRMLLLGCAALTLLAILAAWLGAGIAAFALIAVAWVLHESATMLARVIGPPRGSSPRTRRFGLSQVCEVLVDAALLASMALFTATPERLGLVELTFPPLVLLLVLRLVPRVTSGRMNSWTGDRALLAIVLLALHLLDWLLPGIRLLIVLMLTALLIPAITRSGLTRD